MLAINNLSSDDHAIIFKHLKRKNLDKHAVLFEAESCGESMFFLESGMLIAVNNLNPNENGVNKDIVASIKPGGFCGEEVVLGENNLYSFSIVASENSVVLELSKEELQKIVAESLTTATKLLLAISKNYREAVETMDPKLGKKIGFVSAKDGSGRTTLAMSIAATLAKEGHRVIVIDAELQLGDCYLHMGTASKPNIAMLVQREERLTFSRIEKYFLKKNGLSLLAAPELPQEADLVSRSSMNQIVQECARNADYVVVAIASHIDDYSILLWDICDLIVFVTRSSLPEITRFKRLLTALSSLNYPMGKFMGILNRFSPEQIPYLDEYKKMLESNWFTIANDPATLGEGIYRGHSFVEFSSESPARRDIKAICDFIVAGKIEQKQPKTGVVKWLSSFFAE